MSVGISVIVPTYRRADLLKRCLFSIQSQVFKDYEVIVVDNAVNDPDTLDLMNAMSDTGIRHIKEQKPGASSARNRGIEEANSDLVLFVDDDDEIAPDMLQKMYDFMTKPEQLDVDFTWTGVAKLYEVNGKIIARSEFLVAEKDLQDMTFIVKVGTGCGVCIRKSALLEVGGFDESYKLSEDRDLFMRLVQAGKKFRPLNEVLYKRYYHCGKRLSESLHALDEAEHYYRLYYENLALVMQYPELRLRLLDLRAKCYFDGEEYERSVDVAYHAWQIRPYRLRSIRRLAKFYLALNILKLHWIKSRFI